MKLVYDEIYFDGGIERYLLVLQGLGWVQTLVDRVFIGDLEDDEADRLIAALDDIDPYGYTLKMSASGE